jgi:hypothetical protein
MKTFFGRTNSRAAEARLRNVLGRHIPISLLTLAKESRVPERRARRLIEGLERDGWLMIEINAARTAIIRVIPAANIELLRDVVAGLPPPSEDNEVSPVIVPETW